LDQGPNGKGAKIRRMIEDKKIERISAEGRH
jgi:hypothetical protein